MRDGWRRPAAGGYFQRGQLRFQLRSKIALRIGLGHKDREGGTFLAERREGDDRTSLCGPHLYGRRGQGGCRAVRVRLWTELITCLMWSSSLVAGIPVRI